MVDGRRVDLERARREAKALLRAAREGDHVALARLRAGGCERPEAAKLADAQRTLAREHGARSWSALVRRAAAEGEPDRARAFVEAATSRRRDHAEAVREADPEVVRRSLDAALVFGDVDAVRAHFRGLTPDVRCGVREWAPLLYVTHSAYLGGERTEGLLACARLLLDAGADPNAAYEDPRWGPQSALYGAAGVAHEPRMTALLLEAGADPDDDESLYHACEAPGTDLVRLLLDAGARVAGTNALAHALDREDPELVRLLLAGGPSSVELDRALPWAIFRRRSPQVVRMLVEAGADPARRRGDDTPYGLARRYADDALAELLVQLGAPRDATAMDELLGATERGDVDRARELATPQLLERLRGDLAGTLVEAAAEGRLPAVGALLALGVPIGTRGQLDGTALHHAAWRGWRHITEHLLAGGADPVARTKDGGTPLSWAAHGSASHHDPRADHVAVAELLVAAGAAPDAAMAREAAGPLAVWLRERAEPDLGELAWAAHVAYLELLARVPEVEVLVVGEGFAVRSGLESNAENGVVCDGVARDAAGPPDAAALVDAALAFLGGAWAQWLVRDPAPALVAALRDAGARPERTAVEVGGAAAGLVAGAPPAGVRLTDPGGALGACFDLLEAAGLVDTDAADRARRRRLLGQLPLLRGAAVRGSRTVGYVAVQVHGTTARVLDLAVDAAERRRGVGRALVTEAVRRGGAARVVAEATPGSLPFFGLLGLRVVAFPADRVWYLPAG